MRGERQPWVGMPQAPQSQLDRLFGLGRITLPMLSAGRQFRGDYLLQQSTGRGRDSLAREPGAVSGPLEVTAAARRVRYVMAALGVSGMRLLVGVTVEDRSPAEVARELGMDSDWGAPTLRLALGEVVKVYGVVEAA